MTWEQKVAACQAIADMSLRMRKPGDWYVSSPVERKMGILLSGASVSGVTPEDAVNKYWDWITNELFYVVVNAYRRDRKAYRWNGFMWAEVAEKNEAAA